VQALKKLVSPLEQLKCTFILAYMEAIAKTLKKEAVSFPDTASFLGGH
jgi:hypothetical protein